jgi:hypothetical protein
MATQIQFRRDTAANWTSNNPTLAIGEAGFETDTRKIKIGDGSTVWTSLNYVSGYGAIPGSDGQIVFNDSGILGANSNFSYISGNILNVGSTISTSANVHITGAIKDSSGDYGTSGQVLSSTGTGIDWIDGGGSWELVETLTITGSPTAVDFDQWDDLATHEYAITMDGVTFAATSQDLYMRVLDNGTPETESKYAYTQWAGNPTASGVSGNASRGAQQVGGANQYYNDGFYDGIWRFWENRQGTPVWYGITIALDDTAYPASRILMGSYQGTFTTGWDGVRFYSFYGGAFENDGIFRVWKRAITDFILPT